VRLVDANVLIYAVNRSTAHHGLAQSWLDGALAGRETIGFSWSVVLAFLRLATHPAVFARPLTSEEAVAIVRAWLAQPSAVIIDPSPRHIDLVAGFLAEAGTAGSLVNDAHLAALTIEHDATLVSFDTDFARFAGLRWEVPA
jgi:toxin-antitoxin system PIN domain toxin